MQEFSQKLKILRKSKSITQKQAALALELNERNYQHYEAGTQKPSFDGLAKLCTYFDVSADYLLGLSDDPSRK